jgi:hypothetical protein
MKRWLAFAGMRYYPQPGLGDFVDSFDTFEQARTAALNARETFYAWAMVCDRDNPKDPEPWYETID